MSEYPIEVNGIWKKFRKGDKVYALRDVIPVLTKGLLKGNKKPELTDEEFWVLQDVNFKVKKGEVLGIIGPNGAGKSTILKTLSKLLKPDQGDIKIRGRLSALIEVTAGFHPEFTGRENIYFNGAILGMSKKEIDRKFDDIVEFSGVGEFIDTPVKRYSSGMSARLGFAVSAHVDPDILLVDEVLSVGDMTFQKKCTDKMRELLNKGTTIIFISHNIPLMQSLCERILLLSKGQIIKEGSPEEVIPYYQDLVFKRQEERVKARINSVGMDDVSAQEETLLKINKISVSDLNGNEKEDFDFGESVRLNIDYDLVSGERDLVFSYEILLPDGRMCCTSNTANDNVNVTAKTGNNTLSIDIIEPRLVPNVYFTKVSIWDKGMVHPYTIKKEGVFRFNIGHNIKRCFTAVFMAKTNWHINI